MSLLEVTGLAKHFQIHALDRSVAAFDQLNFVLAPGEFKLVVGANGVGKSTLLRCLYRTYLPSTGQANYQSRQGLVDLSVADEQTILRLRQHELGYVTQFLRIRPRVSAQDWVAEALRSTGETVQRSLYQAQAQLDWFGLKPQLWAAYPSTFSGGEQQKVNLARALIRPSQLLLLDEPTASLDAATRQALVGRLAQLRQQGVAMLGVFHHPEDVRDLVDGRIEISGVEVTHVAE